MKPIYPLTAAYLTELLPAFRQCDNYTDRLAFFEKYHLIESLCISTIEFDSDADRGRTIINFGMNLYAECRTWEDVKQWPILTVTPFTREEAQHFVEWGLRIRPGMSDAPVSVEALQTAFVTKYYEYDFPDRREKYLDDYRITARLWLDGKLSTNHAQSRNIASALNIDLALFEKLIHKQIEKEPTDLSSHIRLTDPNINWTAIDTHLFTQSRYLFAKFLLKTFNPADPQYQPTSMPVVNEEPKFTIREQILIHCYEQQEVIKKGAPNYNTYITFATPRKRLAYSNGSVARAKRLIESIEKILPFLTEKAAQQAASEINTIEANI